MGATVYLIRHGETEGGEVRRYKGRIDVPLSENGVRHIKEVSKHVVKLVRRGTTYKSSWQRSCYSRHSVKEGKGRVLDAVYCSDLIRAIKSAEIIAKPYKLKPVVIHGLRERDFGIWEGMTFAEIREKYPVEFDAWAGNPLKYSPIDGENTLEVGERVIKAFDKIVRSHSEGHIAIVSHGGINRVILCHILGISLENIFRIEQDYGALNIIEFWDRYPVVKLINGVICG